MKGDISMIIFAIVVLCLSVILVLWITGEANEMLDLCDHILQTIDEDPSSTQESIEKLNDLWATRNITWQFISIHDDLHEISDALTELTYAFFEGDSHDAKMHCEVLKNAINAVITKETLSLENIF